MRTAAHVNILIIITQGIYVNYICSIRIDAKDYKTLGTLFNVICIFLKSHRNEISVQVKKSI